MDIFDLARSHYQAGATINITQGAHNDFLYLSVEYSDGRSVEFGFKDFDRFDHARIRPRESYITEDYQVAVRAARVPTLMAEADAHPDPEELLK